MRWQLRLLIAVIALFLSACSEEPEQAIRIGSSPWPGYEPLYLARDLGYFDHNRVSLFELPSADITLESFRNHSVDIASLPLDSVLELIQEGSQIKIILIMNISHGGDVVLVKPDIKHLTDIKGKRVAAVNIPLGLYMLSRLLDRAGLEKKDIELSLMSETEQEAFYKSGQADVVITYDPVKTALQKAGMKTIFDSTDIPNEIFDILVVHESVYLSHKKDVCEVVNQWFETLDYIHENQQDAAVKISRRLGVSESDYHQMLKGIIIPDKKTVKAMLGGEKPELVPAANRLASILQKERLIKDFADVSGAIDTDFVSCIN